MGLILNLVTVAPFLAKLLYIGTKDSTIGVFGVEIIKVHLGKGAYECLPLDTHPITP